MSQEQPPGRGLPHRFAEAAEAKTLALRLGGRVETWAERCRKEQFKRHAGADQALDERELAEIWIKAQDQFVSATLCQAAEVKVGAGEGMFKDA